MMSLFLMAACLSGFWIGRWLKDFLIITFIGNRLIDAKMFKEVFSLLNIGLQAAFVCWVSSLVCWPSDGVISPIVSGIEAFLITIVVGFI